MKTDIMVPVPFEKLLRHITDEYAHEKSIFGIKKLYKNQKNTESERFSIFNENPELPFGPAAGPHTQLAQNIVAAYVCGSRFFELKTVQILDGEDLPVSKPCIIAHDEAYNCEWSTELYVPQALEEYIKAWILLHILAIEFDLGRTDGFVFNMSVGYDLKGIQSEKIDSFIENLKNAAGTPVFEECKKITLQAVESGHLKKFGKNDIANIRENICAGITLSTLHGCPSDEIERIATYLLTQKKLHTFIKCNPTLLGYDFARSALDKLGFDYITFDEHHFKADLQFDDAIPMFKRLQTLADSLNLSFGIKLTNTFAVDVTANELPSEEMYMSGRSLAPLSLNVAKKVSQAMNGMLRISYSGGADFYNIVDIYNCGIWPITLATTLLKPGGYERLAQIAEQFENVPHKDFTGIDIVATEKLADLCTEGNGCSINAIGMYKKSVKPIASRKLPKKVPLFNCFTASCGETCPIHQDIPTYIRLNGEKNYREALKVIIDKNPLPFITGTICSHPCMNSCTRSFYEGSVHIRSEKLKAATAAYDEILKEVRQSAHAKNDENIHIAIIGAGPAGLSAAYFASRANIKATVFEKCKTAGGIIRHIIPGFRIQDDAIEKDIDFIKACGADIITDTEITSVQDLFDKGFTHVILALGAWHKTDITIDGINPTDSLTFLADFKRAESDATAQKELAEKYGSDIIIIGGGNTAMDSACVATRIPGVKNVKLVYRRTKRYMPADEEELKHALLAGVEFCELLAPIGFQDGALLCSVMELTAADSSGRKSPQKTGKTLSIPASSVITATGSAVDKDFYIANDIAVTEKGLPVLSENLQTSREHVYVAGDGAKGPATVVEAIADATRVINAVIGKTAEEKSSRHMQYKAKTHLPREKKGILFTADNKDKEAQRCLECSTVCELCCDVCPNRANISIEVNENPQIIHIDDYCNECGNCSVFCPYESNPYKDKFTLFGSQKSLTASTNDGFFVDEKTAVKIRLNGTLYETDITNCENALKNVQNAENAIALIKEVWYNKSYVMNRY